MNKVFIFLLLFLINDAFSNPMESIEKYNVIIVHGAAVSASGMDCENETFDEVYDIELAEDGYFARLDGIDGHSIVTIVHHRA